MIKQRALIETVGLLYLMPSVTIVGYLRKGGHMAINKKLTLNIKGRFQKYWVNLFLNRKVRSLGLSVDKVEHQSVSQSKVIVSGEQKKLWQVIDWSRKPSFFVRLDHIIFEFKD
jgi:hypothetical protein